MNADSSTFSRETITWIQAVTPKLFRFRTTRPAGFRFAAGQWARLGVTRKALGTPVWRAYSIASATYDEHLEFYSIVVPDGEFTSELAQLKLGDTLLVEKQAYGFLTPSRFQTSPGAAGNDLWLLSTGTGLAPFVSVLQELEVWQTYERIIVVHGVREAKELAYAEEIEALKTHEALADFWQANPQQLVYQACVTRDTVARTPAHTGDALQGRITTLIQNGELERHLGIALDPERSRVMICGNPEMVDDTRSALKARGMSVSRNAKPGQMAVENYW